MRTRMGEDKSNDSVPPNQDTNNRKTQEIASHKSNPTMGLSQNISRSRSEEISWCVRWGGRMVLRFCPESLFGFAYLRCR